MWLVGVPVLYAAAFARKGGLPALWGAMPAVYVVVNVLMAATYARADWARISDAVRRKERQQGAGTDEGEGDDAGGDAAADAVAGGGGVLEDDDGVALI